MGNPMVGSWLFITLGSTGLGLCFFYKNDYDKVNLIMDCVRGCRRCRVGREGGVVEWGG